ncbi:hypothetical protein WAI453_001524 [Rhynchosporium graminicola]|uniref:Related to Extracellular metalloprotease MGG_08041 n=1 Tax=Rhynchosporium graminicola TaxID=2792576 RepID=A0A1E1KC69_9HELO|nr:related to Extracellular metalloprotease MGG_08041 [Rhynchosporium commune]
MVRLTLTAALASLLPFVVAIPTELWTREDFRGECGTVTTPQDLAVIAAVAGNSSSFASTNGFLASALPSYSIEPWQLGDITVKTWIHVVSVDGTPAGGNIPESQLIAQIAVLNENFAPNHVQFTLEGITRTVNAAWSTDVTGAEIQMKSALRKGDYKTLNLYFQTVLRGNALGYAYYPAATTVGSRAFNLSGATNLFSTVPGGSATNYNLGKTVTHEVGHWMGLAHTFDGLSCSGPGDYIADTATHSAPSRGCPIGLDTCLDGEGPDPIHNYMDYSYDSCYEEFTALQTKRMFDMWNMYRQPRACSADNCLRALRLDSIPGRLEESQAFCGEFTKFLVSEVTQVKSYAVSACAGNVVSRVSSACSCLPTPTAT